MLKFARRIFPPMMLAMVLAAPASADPPTQLDVAAAKAKMIELAKDTKPGMFFPETKIPDRATAFRMAVLTVGNAARRDPNYRRNNKTANNLSGDTTRTDKADEKIFKDSPTPPYFEDIEFYKELNEACQYWAEYQASKDWLGHEAPGLKLQGDDMSTPWARFEHFSGFDGITPEGAGMSTEADSYPEGWMQNETHYRPWFNIGHRTVAMGFGIAQNAKSGHWYACKIALVDDDAKAAKLTLTQSLDPDRMNGKKTKKAAAAPAAPAAGAPAAAGSVSFDPGKWYGIASAVNVDGTFDYPVLDVISSGSDENQIAVQKSGNYSGQMWKIRTDGKFFKLTTSFKGDNMCLAASPSGGSTTAFLAACDGSADQKWSITSLGPDGFNLELFRLTTKSLKDQCLRPAKVELGSKAVVGSCDGSRDWHIGARN